MKTSFSSTVSVQTSLRQAMAKAQTELMKANEEVTTGVHADMGVTLGANTTRNLDLTRDVMRIDAQLTTNSIATTRLTSSEEAMSTLTSVSQDVLDVLTALSGSTSTLDDAQRSLQVALSTFTDVANTSVSGEYLFSGTNTDVKPLTAYNEAGSPFKAAVDAELNHFLSTNGIASAESMSPADMESFLTDLEAKFNGTMALEAAANVGEDLWSAFVSDASDTNMTTRINASEVVETSTNANSAGFRSFMFATVVSSEFLRPDMQEQTRSVVTDRSANAIGKAISGVNAQRSEIGLSTERVTRSNDALEAQKKIIEVHLNDLQGVDAYEASTRVTSLQALLEAAYTLTSRIQQLSLVNFL